eukprot:7951554-Alexandrium_andersonii.AAC.1
MSASLVGSEMCIRDSPRRGSAGNCSKRLETAGTCCSKRWKRCRPSASVCLLYTSDAADDM